MAEELNREQVTERMQAIFRSSLEGDELDKALASIDKRLDKFEGKWDGLIKWAETKYGKPQEIPDSADSEDNQAEEPKKKRGMFGFGKKKQESGATPEEIIDGIKVKDSLESKDGRGVIFHLHYLPSDREFKFKVSKFWRGFPQLQRGAKQILKGWEGLSRYSEAMVTVIVASAPIPVPVSDFKGTAVVLLNE